jgi:Mn2+/Fe2+ NRAMP family transporter
MWQRIQTIFMAAGAVCFLLFLTVPSGMLNGSEIGAGDTKIRSALSVAGFLLLCYSILSFKNRRQQRLINWIVIGMVVVIYVLWLFDPIRTEAGYALNWGMYMPGFVIPLLLLANYFIQKDDNLIRSMDRLR